jgi:hypothetical protein
MKTIQDTIDKLIEEWYTIKTIEFEQGNTFVISEELQCPKCTRSFYAHTTTIRELINHVIDHLAEKEAVA